jgi:hypothetical protein
VPAPAPKSASKFEVLVAFGIPDSEGKGVCLFRGSSQGWLESEREPQCPRAVEGRWRERGTPFSKLSETATRGERSRKHSTASMLAARIHSYGDPIGIKIGQAPRPEPVRAQVLVRAKAAGVSPWTGGGIPGLLERHCSLVI